MSDPLDVTGAWEGVFSYPGGKAPGGFRAELREADGVVDGETEERSDAAHDAGRTIHALLAGTRNAAAVAFTKRYDDLSRAHHPVHYAGTLSPEGDEIAGRWTIPGNWSGSFLMVRASRRAAPAARETAEPVR